MRTCRFRATLFLLALILSAPAAVPQSASAAEPWADQRLIVTDGLELWLDAARAAGESKELPSQLATWRDASGHGRDVKQRDEKHSPKLQSDLVRDKTIPIAHFDGENDSLLIRDLNRDYRELTLFVVAAPRTNPGNFRALLSFNRRGQNDYITGFNLDQHGIPSLQFDILNVEGAGFRGAIDQMEQVHPLGTFHVITTAVGSGERGVRMFVDGKASGVRDRADAVMRADDLRIGCRHYSNTADPTSDQGFWDGHIAEVLLYDRVLENEERGKVEAYLAEKHAELLKFVPDYAREGKMLVAVKDPPAVQVLVPGFAVQKLPLELPNINNLRYRHDGRLVAQAYDGNLFLLSDTDGDELEDHADLWWDNASGSIQSPIGIVLTPPNYPHGNGVLVACKGKIALLTDTDGDDRLDHERVVASGWPPIIHNVDTLGLAMAPDGSLFFGIGCTNFTSAYLVDDKGQAHYDLKNERGTILRIAPDLKSREIWCTGIRFPVGLAFNKAGDLFCSDQEGATWLSNGNPLDELLHIQKDRHYGFPPRHPKHLPNVIDEPSTFDYAPQHQSTCGLTFNVPVKEGGPTFGPQSWSGDALLAGYSRGKVYRTKLVETGVGYVAQNNLLACLQMLPADLCVSPGGELLVACHSGGPDWGSGPSGKGTLFRIDYHDRLVPMPAHTWCSAPDEVRIAFDQPLDPESLRGLRERITIEGGEAVAAGDRFETLRPGYAVVAAQMYEPRYELKVHSVALTPDNRTLVLSTERHRPGLTYSITLERWNEGNLASLPYGIKQTPDVDLQYDLHGVEVSFEPNAEIARKVGEEVKPWSGILPHADLKVARPFTVGSAEHEEFFKRIDWPGKLSLRGQLLLDDMLRPKVQPGSKIDYEWPSEAVRVLFVTDQGPGSFAQSNQVHVAPGHPSVAELDLAFNFRPRTSLHVKWSTDEDATFRPLPLHRLTHHRLAIADKSESSELAVPPELAGGDWLRGREVFFSNDAQCAKCHAVAGQGGAIGPNLSNLRHRDYASVLRDVTLPSYAINPDYIGYGVQLADGRALAGVVRNEGDKLRIGDSKGTETLIARDDVELIKAQTVSVMPEGLPKALGPDRLRDLLTFLLLAPPSELDPAPITRPGAPKPRTKAEVDAVLAGSTPIDGEKLRPLEIVLVSGPKDHGINEHDYPDWQKRWAKLLSLAPKVKVGTADVWPSPEQLKTADVLVWYSANPAWTQEKAKELDAFQARGGGMVYLHFAVNGQRAPEQLAERIGLAWGPGAKFRHGPVDLNFERDETSLIVRNFTGAHFEDESYWNLLGDVSKINVLATAPEEGEQRPLLWTYEREMKGERPKARVFGSILGHYSWTFDDPLFRTLVFRGIAWTADEPVDRFNELVTIGARVE